MLSINPVSFCAKLMRETYCTKDPRTRKRVRIETGRDEFISGYTGEIERIQAQRDEFIAKCDSQIKKVQDQRDFAVKLDDMMHNDDDIAKIISELPDELDIEVAGNFAVERLENDELKFVPPMLLASEDAVIETEKAKSMSPQELHGYLNLYFECSKEGPDKKQIIGWLNNLKTFFEK